MATRKSMTAEATVLFNGTQANNAMEQLGKRAESLEKKIDKLKEKLGESYKENQGYIELQKELQTVNSLFNAGVEKVNQYSRAMNDMTGMTVRQLQAAATQAKNFQRSFSDNSSQEVVGRTANLLDQIMTRIKNLRSGFTDTMQAAQNTTGMTVVQLQRLHSALMEEQKLVATDEQSWTRYQNVIDKVGNAINAYANESKKLAAVDVMNNLDVASEKEIRDSIKVLQELRTTLTYGSQEWKDIGVQIQTAQDYLKNFDTAAKQNTMVQQFQNLQNISASALGEQKKYWTEVRDAAAPYSRELDDARQKLEAIQQLEQTRTKSEATTILNDVQSGNFTGTIAQTKEAVQLLEKYRSLLDVKDVQGIVATDDAIAKLNKSLADSNNQWANYNDALKAASEVRDGTFAGTYKDLEKIRKSLVEYKAQLKTSDTKGLIEVNNALRQIDIAQNRAKNGIVDINDVITNIKTTPLDQLQLAAKQLEERLNGATRGTREFVQASADLRQIRGQIQTTNRLWENHENVIVRTAKRLASYVLIYAGFNQIVGQIKAMISANLELSDSLADIRKTTGMTEEAVSNLSRSIDQIDTRTGQQQLHELAAVAGQIGLRSQEDVLGFVKASNMITVSLNELGSEGTASLMKLAQLTGDVQKLGVEKSLLAIGGAINELSASSAATAGPIVDLMNRLGGIAAQSHISTSELAAIGATADALGQSMEVTGTSMNKFIATLLSSSDQIAYAVNMDAKALRDMLESGKTMDAIIAVMQKMNEMGGIQALAPIMGDLGSEGARMTAVLSALSKNVDFLKDQVDLSREAFAEATSIQNEYNVKNENAIAILQRMGNAIKEAFVNSGVVSALRDILSATMDLFNWFARGESAARALTSVILGLTTALLAHRLEWVRNINAMTGAVIYSKIAGWMTVARTSIIAFGRSMFTASTYTNLATTSVNKLKAALTKNWFTLLIGALAAIGTWLYKTATYVSDLTKAQAEYNAELEKELTRVDALFYSLDRYNLKGAERKKIIDQINKQYGEYLGFMLTEKDSAEKLAAAHRLVNAELRKKMALSLQSKLEENISEQFAGQLNELMTSMGKSLEKAQGIGEAFSREAVSIVTDVIRNNVDKPNEVILQAVKEGLAQKYDTRQGTFGSSAFFDIQGDIKNFIQARKDYQNAVEMTSEYAGREIKQATSATVKEGINLLNQLNDKYNELYQKDLTGMNKEQMEAHYKELLSAAQNYVSAAGKQMDRLGDNEKKNLETVVNAYNTQIENIKKKLPDVDAWGKNLNLQGWKESLDNLSTASVESLVKVYKELQDAPKLISDVSKYNKMFGTSFTNLGQVMEDTKDKAKQIKDQLASMGRNTAGNFLWGGNGGNRSAIAEAKREYEAALSALESYYNERETLVREHAMQENQTEEELQRNLDALEEEHLNARIALRKKILSKQDTSFETKYAQVVTSDYFKDIDLNKLSDQLNKFGKQMTQGVERKMTEDEVKILERAWKIQSEISKILLENDPVKKVAEQYSKSFEKLDMFWNQDEARTKENAQKKMAVLLEYSGKQATLSSEDMRKQLESSEEFGGVVAKMNAEAYQAFLILLNQYSEAAVNARRTATQKAVSNLKFNFDNSDIGEAIKSQLTEIESSQTQISDLQTKGLMLDETALNKKRELAAQEIALTLQRFDTMIAAEQNGLNREDVLRELRMGRDKAELEARQTITNLLIEEDQKRFDRQLNDVDNMQEFGAISEVDAIERKRALVEAEVALQQQRVDALISIEEEGANRQDVLDNLKSAKQDILYQKEQRLTELTMQEYQKRAAVAQEWGTAIGDGLGNMIAGTENAGQELVKNLAKMAVQSLGQMAQMFVAKRLLMSQQNVAEATSAATTATTAAAEATAVGAAKTAEATAIAMATPDSVLSFGAAGAAKAAVIGGLIAAAVAASMAIISSLFPKASTPTASAVKNKKLTTGMLTYAEGDYPVLGNDGQVYNARYQKELKTGVYGGGAHFGIFSEKKPEMIVDGTTTEKLIVNYPHIYDAITTIAKHGRLKNAAMPTYAAGDYPAGMKNISINDADNTMTNGDVQMAQMQSTISRMESTIAALNDTLARGIGATIDPYANYKADEKANRFMYRRGMKK